MCKKMKVRDCCFWPHIRRNSRHTNVKWHHGWEAQGLETSFSEHLMKCLISTQYINLQKEKRVVMQDCDFYDQHFCAVTTTDPFSPRMSNWRPAGRMRPHCLSNAARGFLIETQNYSNWLIFTHILIENGPKKFFCLWI